MLASANPDKAQEIRAIMGDAIELEPRPAHVPDVVEDGATLTDNARLKAVALCDATGLPALADDTGLEVDALGGAPGVWSARYAGEHASYRDNVVKLLAALDGVADGARTARFRTVALLRFPDGRELIADGVVEGRIAREVRGANGFGYDPLFVPTEGDGRSFAEMDGDEKHAISHRGRAVRALAAQINATDIR
ncbi:MAG: RdgB/HAM1 family non-canonical purine NTP pyrophosphatase [Acidimicrobiales bacterium]